MTTILQKLKTRTITKKHQQNPTTAKTSRWEHPISRHALKGASPGGAPPPGGAVGAARGGQRPDVGAPRGAGASLRDDVAPTARRLLPLSGSPVVVVRCCFSCRHCLQGFGVLVSHGVDRGWMRPGWLSLGWSDGKGCKWWRWSDRLDMIMLFKGNSSRLEHLIEKIQANKENHEVSSDEIKGLIY